MSEPDSGPDVEVKEEPSEGDSVPPTSGLGEGGPSESGDASGPTDGESGGGGSKDEESSPRSGEKPSGTGTKASLDVFDDLPPKAKARPSRPPPPPGQQIVSTSAGQPPPPPPVSAKAPPPPPSGKAAPPPPSPVKTSSPSSSSSPEPVSPNWDDDDEDTATLARSDQRRKIAPVPAAVAAQSGRVASVPPPAPVPVPAPAPVPPASGRASVPSIPPPTPSVAGQQVAPAGGMSVATLLLGAVVIVGLVAVIAFLLVPRDGALMVTVAGPDNRAVDRVTIYVDGQQRCSTSPCRVGGLSPGTHIVRASAPGFQASAPQAVAVKGGSEGATNLMLGAAVGGTGVKVTASGAKGVRLFVDGRDRGEIPVEIADLEPGQHTIKVAGNDAYAPYEQRVTVREDEVQHLDLKLKVLKGLARVKLGRGAAGAEVYLTGGSQKRRLDRLPMTVSVQADRRYELVATKKGYSEYRREVSFDDGRADKTFVIEMVEVGRASPSDEHKGKTPKNLAVKDDSKKKAGDKAAGGEKATQMGTININSLPASNVILNGRPLGQTPKMGIKVKPGPATVVFVHPQHGRKVRSTVVKPGGTSTVLVRFP